MSDFIVKIGLDGKSSFFPTIEKMNRETRLLTASFSSFDKLLSGLKSGAGAIGLIAVNNQLKEIIERADQINDRSKAFNLDTNTVQRIDNVIGFDKAQGALNKLAEAQQKVLSGDDKDFKVLKAFAELGVSLEDLQRKEFQQVFEQIADAMNRAEISGKKLAAVRDILGKDSSSLIQGFQKGLNSKQANSGLLSEEDLKLLDAMKDQQKTNSIVTVWKEFASVAGIFGNMLKTGITSIPDSVRYILQDPRERSEQNIQNFRARQQQERLDARDKKRAEDQAKAAADKAKAEKDAEKAKEKADKIAEQTSKLRAENEAKILELFREQLPAEERRLSLTRERLALQKQIDAETDPLKREKLVKQLLSVNEAELGMRQESNARYQIASDSLSRIGLFRGGSDSVNFTARQQLDELKAIKTAIRSLEERSRED